MHTYTYLPFTHDIKSSKEKTATLSAHLLNIVTSKFYLPNVPNMIDLVIYIFFLPVSSFSLSPYQEDFINIFLPVVSLRL